jgi:hypothetical protein
MICCDEHAKHLRDASCPWCERDEAVRLLHHVRMVLPNDRWADDTKRAIDAYLARVNK